MPAAVQGKSEDYASWQGGAAQEEADSDASAALPGGAMLKRMRQGRIKPLPQCITNGTSVHSSFTGLTPNSMLTSPIRSGKGSVATPLSRTLAFESDDTMGAHNSSGTRTGNNDSSRLLGARPTIRTISSSKKKMMKGSMVFDLADGVGNDQVVTINCGGKIFQTFLRTMRRIPKTRLWRISNEAFFQDTKYVFLDRNPKCFDAVLEYHRSDWLDKPADVSTGLWEEELHYYNISPDLYLVDDEKHLKVPHRPKKPGWRQMGYDFFEDVTSSMSARLFSSFTLLIVILATVSFVLHSLPDFQSSPWDEIFTNFEGASIVFFTVEYLARLLCAERRVSFVFQALNLVDLGAIVPWYITLLLQSGGGDGFAVLRVIRLTKAFRILRIGKYSKGLQLLLQTLSSSMGELSVMAVFVGIGILLVGSFMYLIEGDSQSDFDTIPKSMWFGIVTLSTVGYGDMMPDTFWGKVIASLSIIVGILMLTGPIAVMSTNFSQRYIENKEQEIKLREAKRHRLHMLNMERMRGKQAFSQIVMSVLTEGRDKKKETGLSPAAYRKFMQNLFRKYDVDHSGAIDTDEVKAALEMLGVEIQEQALYSLMDEFDMEKDGELDISEFTRLVTQAAIDTVEDLPEDLRTLLQSAMGQLGHKNSHNFEH